MAYIGSPPADQASGVRPRDEFTADGTQICFPLSQSVPGSFESGVTIVLDNVPQQPVEAFTVVDTRTLTLTSISGTFTVNETITGATSAATGVVLKVNLNNIVIRGLTGTFSSSENITGGTSAATATTTSVTINEGSGILFSEAPTAASILYVVHEGNATYNLVPTAASVGPSQLSDNLRNFTVDTFTGNGSTTTFTLSDTPSSANSLLVMVDGIVQTRTTNYTLSGAIVTFTDAPDSSAAITIIHLGFSTISRTGLVDGSVTTAKIADNAITSAKLGFDVIVAEDIAANAITVAEISNGAVTSAKLDTNISITNLAYTGTLTGGTGVVNLGSGQVYKDSSGNVGIGTSSPAALLHVGTLNGTGSLNGYTKVAIEATDYAVLTLKCPAANFNQIIFTDTTTTSLGGINYFNSTNATPNAMAFLTAGTERMRIDSSGNLLVGIASARANAGDVQVSKGISFPATQSASSDANTLDDYEEGTFTPTLQGSSTNPTVTYSIQTGSYTKVGNTVTVFIRLQTTAVTGGSGGVRISGLPFATNSTYRNGGAIGYVSNVTFGAGYTQVGLYTNPNNAFLTFTVSGTGIGATEPQMSAIGAGLDITTTYTYSV